MEKFLLVDVRIVERTSLRYVSGSIGRLEGNEEGIRFDPKSLEPEPAPPSYETALNYFPISLTGIVNTCSAV